VPSVQAVDVVAGTVSSITDSHSSKCNKRRREGEKRLSDIFLLAARRPSAGGGRREDLKTHKHFRR
jgi:hypothetical protein